MEGGGRRGPGGCCMQCREAGRREWQLQNGEGLPVAANWYPGELGRWVSEADEKNRDTVNTHD